VGGDLAAHDREFERVRWVRFEDARSLLTFESERGLVDAAASVLDPIRPRPAVEPAPSLRPETTG